MATLNTQKSTFARLENFWTNLEKTGENNRTIDFLNTKLALLENYWSNFVTQHDRLYEHRDSLKDDDYFSEDWYCEGESFYINFKSKLTSLLATKVGAIQQNLGLGAPLGQHKPQIQSTSKSLPRVKLPTFSGKQEEWECFKEMFVSMVKNDPTLTPALKMTHLVSCLEGEAAMRVNSFELIGDNFEVAWDALDRRYNNKRLRLAIQLNKLLGMSPAFSTSVPELTRLLDTVNQCKRALKTLGRPIEHWDDWFIQILVFNLDSATREDWEKSLEGTGVFPTFEKLVTFIENRTKALETAHCSDQPAVSNKTKSQSNSTSTNISSKTTNSSKSITALHTKSNGGSKKTVSGHLQPCVICNGAHYIGYCPSLQQQGAPSRMSTIKQLKLCINCLREGHWASACTSKLKCRVCCQPHHTILHTDHPVDQKKIQSKEGASVDSSLGTRDWTGNSSTGTTNTFATNIGTSTALGTAVVKLLSSTGSWTEARALIDPCSDASFITERVMKRLKSSRSQCKTTITGLGGTVVASSHYQTNVVLASRINSMFNLKFTATMVPKLTEKVPHHPMNFEDLTFIHGLNMADPSLTAPGDIDCLLGNDVYPVMILDGLRKHPQNLAVAQNTELGWILTGSTRRQNQPQHDTSTTLFTFSSIDAELRKFWELEEVPAHRPFCPDENKCEHHFQETHSRTDQGRYVVKLPFREEPSKLDSRNAAMSRLFSMENKFAAQQEFAQLYTSFIQEYINLGHMSKANGSSLINGSGYVLPHHGVFKSDDDRKIRVVFDGSQAATNRKSLNDYLLPGPPLQTDILTVLLRWRKFKYVFKADIVKMYRQILVHPDHRKWQRILWRNRTSDPVEVYELNTVTYGTSSAPYQAIRVLQQLAKDEAETYPLGAVILKENMYVDDALAGSDTLIDALKARQQLQGILNSAGMKLDKWSANNQELLQHLTSNDNDTISFNTTNFVSTLGLRWSPDSDAFHHKVIVQPVDAVITKRAILSEISKLYDPVGWLSPIIVKAKIIMQRLWLSGKDWDAPADEETQHVWVDFRRRLPTLEVLRVPRWVGTLSTATWLLHGFLDASEKAYSATVYLVVPGKITQSVLLTAKSKVAPLKTVSLPRLELLGAELLANLMRRICSDFKVCDTALYCWTDSEIVLGWLLQLVTWQSFYSWTLTYQHCMVDHNLCTAICYDVIGSLKWHVKLRRSIEIV